LHGTRVPEKDIIPTQEELGIGFVPLSPLGNGFLTGKITNSTKFGPGDIRSILTRFTTESVDANQALLDLIGNMAEKKKAIPARTALAWVIAQKPWFVPIPGTRKLYRLEENNGAANIELTEEELTMFNAALARIDVAGSRIYRIRND